VKVLITGGTGFIGSRLARDLLKRGTLNGQRIDQLVLADQFPLPEPAADLGRDARVQVRVGKLLEQCEAFKQDRFDGVFHLASAVSGECEADFELGLRSNLDSTRALLDALRESVARGGKVPRLVFSSSVAVFGPDASNPMPPLVRDDTLPTPQTSYGTQKLICEHLVADYTRKGYIDGRSARLMTVTVRPGKPNGAASSFFSGIIREPLAGQQAILPVDPSVSHPVSSPARTVQGLIAVFEATQDQMGGRAALNLPALNVTVAQMLDALEAVAGKDVRARVLAQPDPTIQRIVSGWSKGAVATRAQALGLQPEQDFSDIVLQYIHDHPGAVTDSARAAAAAFERGRIRH
jgi:nucleoside-diphosphate-sugar epimerase